MNGQEFAVRLQDESDVTSRRGVFGLVVGGLLALGLAAAPGASARRGRRGHNGRHGNGGRHGRRNSRNNRNNNR